MTHDKARTEINDNQDPLSYDTISDKSSNKNLDSSYRNRQIIATTFSFPPKGGEGAGRPIVTYPVEHSMVIYLARRNHINLLQLYNVQKVIAELCGSLILLLQHYHSD